MTNKKEDHSQMKLLRAGCGKTIINIKLQEGREHIIDIDKIEKISNTPEPDSTVLRISGDWTRIDINYRSFATYYYEVVREVLKSDTALNVFIMDFSQSAEGSLRRDDSL